MVLVLCVGRPEQGMISLLGRFGFFPYCPCLYRRDFSDAEPLQYEKYFYFDRPTRDTSSYPESHLLIAHSERHVWNVEMGLVKITEKIHQTGFFVIHRFVEYDGCQSILLRRYFDTFYLKTHRIPFV